MKRIAVVALNGCYASSVGRLLDMVQMANTLVDDERRIVCEVISLTGAPARLTDCITIPPASSLDAAKALGGRVDMRRLANLGPERGRVSMMASRADAAMPEALQWIRTEGAWRCCPVR